MILAYAALASALVASGATWLIASDHYEAAALRTKLASDKAIEAANEKADNAAIDYQAWMEVQRPKVITITRTIRDELSKPDPSGCTAQPLPDGLRAALAAAADPDRPLPDGAVPAGQAASAADVGRPPDAVR